MLCRVVASCILILVLPLLAVGQGGPKTVEDLAKEVIDLQTQLKTATQNLSQLTNQVKLNTEASSKNSESFTRITDVINRELANQQELLDEMNRLTQLQQDQLSQQQHILQSISQKDSQGNDVLSLKVNIDKSDEFREEVQKAVNQSLDTQGDVTIRNRMNSHQRIVVNKKEYEINAGESLTLKVPVGTLSTQLPGQRLMNWTVQAPTYKQDIDIVPEVPETVALRPLYVGSTAPVYTDPVYVESMYVDSGETIYMPPVYYSPSVTTYYWPY